MDLVTAERLLTGRLDLADASPAIARLAWLLAAATAPPTPEELAGERAAVAQFAAAKRSHHPVVSQRRASAVGRLVSVKVAAAVLAALLAIGGVAAAATGRLAGKASRVAEHAPVTTAAGSDVDAAAVGMREAAAKAGLCQAWQAGPGGEGGRPADSPAFRTLALAAGSADAVAAYCKDATAGRTTGSGSDAIAAARAGLCQAWISGQAGDQGRREDAVAMQVLAAAAGGADKVGDFCAATNAGSAGMHQQHLNTSPTSITPPSIAGAPASSRPPASTGPPASTSPGGPPTTNG